MILAQSSKVKTSTQKLCTRKTHTYKIKRLRNDYLRSVTEPQPHVCIFNGECVYKTTPRVLRHPFGHAVCHFFYILIIMVSVAVEKDVIKQAPRVYPVG